MLKPLAFYRLEEKYAKLVVTKKFLFFMLPIYIIISSIPFISYFIWQYVYIYIHDRYIYIYINIYIYIYIIFVFLFLFFFFIVFDNFVYKTPNLWFKLILIHLLEIQLYILNSPNILFMMQGLQIFFMHKFIMLLSVFNRIIWQILST